MSRSLDELYETSPLFGANAPYVEDLYERFLSDPGSVPEVWQAYFSGVKAGSEREVAHGPVKQSILDRASLPRSAAAVPAGDDSWKQGAVSRLIQIYANRGHLVAKIDPLDMMQRPTPRVLELGYLGLTEADLDGEFFTGSRIPGRAGADEVARHHRAVEAHLHRPGGRRVRPCVRGGGAAVAAGAGSRTVACTIASRARRSATCFGN